MTSPAPLTETEQAAAEALAAVLNRHERNAGNVDCWNAADFADEARAVVGAVEPHLTIAALERTVAALEEFAAHKHRAGHRRDAVGIDEAAELVLDQLRTLRTRLSLSRPTSEETPDA